VNINADALKRKKKPAADGYDELADADNYKNFNDA